jgi:hypothetical protein
MKKRIVKPAVWLIVALTSACGMEFYVAKIWSAGQPSQFSDLYAPWWGAHELFLHHRNPYTPAVAREIQAAIYGAPLTSENGGDFFGLAGGFAYPLYATFLLWPTVNMLFSTLRTLFICLSIIVTLGSLGLWLRAFHFRGPPLEWLTLALFTLGSFPVLQGIRMQNLSVIAAAILTLSVVLLSTGHLSLGGVLLAASTFKPQFTLVLVPWLTLWAASDWRRRQSFLWSFLASMVVLIGASEWMLPGWQNGFLNVVHAYRHYTFGHSLLDVWFTPRVGPFAAAGLLLVVLALCWKCRRAEADSPRFLAAISIMLAATITVIPTLAPHTQVLLLPGFLCLHFHRLLLWRSNRWARLALLGLCLLFAWPWLAAAGLTLAAVLLPTSELLRWWDVPLYTSPLLPLAVLLPLCCLIRIRIWPDDAGLDPARDGSL